MSVSTVYVEHKPGLKYPYQVRVINRAGKSVMLYGHRTEEEANKKAQQIKGSGE